MTDLYCPRCGLEQPRDHLYCVRCGTAVPAYLLEGAPAKTARLFAGIRVAENDEEGAFLRVSCYREDQIFESDEGSVTIPGHHVRFSVWSQNKAKCVISLPETEAADLAHFLSGHVAAGSFSNGEPEVDAL